MVVQYYGRFIPGHPTVVAQNMPGASSFKASNYIYNAAPKDGTYLGALDSTIPLAQKTKHQGKFDPEKFLWIGRLAADDSVGLTWHTTGVKTVADAEKKSIAMASGGASGPSAMICWALNRLLGTKFKVILGYRGSAPMVASMEQGETGGAGTFGWTALKLLKHNWIEQKLVNVIYVVALHRNPDLPNVPALPELAKNDIDRKVLTMIASRSEIGRAYVAPPGVAAERGKVLRRAFDAMVKDPGFLADMKKRKIDLSPATGAEVQKIVEDVMDAPPKVVERTTWATAVEK
jgi:tripartite-type tricarboxylate transporter receptor subunit TctC